MTATFIIAKIKMYDSSLPEGGSELRRCNIDGGYSLAMEHLFRIDGLRFFGRVFNVPPVMQVNNEYEVIVRLLNPCLILPHLAVGKQFYIESLCDIGVGTVAEIHDYGDYLTSWSPSDCPWSGNGVKRPDYYLTMNLLKDGKFPLACFVRRKTEMLDGILHEVSIDPTLSDETARELGMKSSELIVQFSRRAILAGKAAVISASQDGGRDGEKTADCRIYPTWDAWRTSIRA